MMICSTGGESLMFGGQQYDDMLHWGESLMFGGQQYDETVHWGESYVWRAAV